MRRAPARAAPARIACAAPPAAARARGSVGGAGARAGRAGDPGRRRRGRGRGRSPLGAGCPAAPTARPQRAIWAPQPAGAAPAAPASPGPAPGGASFTLARRHPAEFSRAARSVGPPWVQGTHRHPRSSPAMPSPRPLFLRRRSPAAAEPKRGGWDLGQPGSRRSRLRFGSRAFRRGAARAARVRSPPPALARPAGPRCASPSRRRPYLPTHAHARPANPQQHPFSGSRSQRCVYLRLKPIFGGLVPYAFSDGLARSANEEGRGRQRRRRKRSPDDAPTSWPLAQPLMP